MTDQLFLYYFSLLYGEKETVYGRKDVDRERINVSIAPLYYFLDFFTLFSVSVFSVSGPVAI